MSRVAPHGPFKVSVAFSVDVGEGRIANVSFDCPVGNLPTEEKLAILAEKALEEAKRLCPEARFLTREEFIQEAMVEMTGGLQLSVPEPEIGFEHEVFKS